MNILISEAQDFSEQALALLRRLGSVETCDMSRNELQNALENCDALWIRLRHRIDADLLQNAPHLKYIISPTTGINHIDTAYLSGRSIELISLMGETKFLRNIRATAEHTIGLIMMMLRQSYPAVSDVLEGNWQRDRFRGNEIYDKTVGIVGYGRLGTLVAEYLLAFGARVLVYDPYISHIENVAVTNLYSFDELLQQSDIVSVHAALTIETYQLFNHNAFLKMKQGAWFVNTARGEIVVENDLLIALQSGRLRGAALDVLCDEQNLTLCEHSLLHYAKHFSNLIITPHIGGCTIESTAKVECYLAQKFYERICSNSSLL